MLHGIKRIAPGLMLLVGCQRSPSEGDAPDLSVPLVDAAVPLDQTVILDLAPPPDIANCAAGWLHSDAGDACPLHCSNKIAPVPPEPGADADGYYSPTDDYMTKVPSQHNPPASGMHWPSP